MPARPLPGRAGRCASGRDVRPGHLANPRLAKKAPPGAPACNHPPVLVRGGLGLGIIVFAVWVYCLLEVIMTDESRIRNLSKTTWIMIVLLTFEVGAVAWLVAGRPTAQPRDLPYKGNTGRPVPRYTEYDRPGRFAATNPDDEAFLRQVRERAEQQTRAAREQRAERERQAELERRAEAEGRTAQDGSP